MVLLSKTPFHDLLNEIFVVLGGDEEEPFDLVIRCVRAFFRVTLPKFHGGSIVSHHRSPPDAAANATVFRIIEVAAAQPGRRRLPKVDWR
jgi:hypothetical protein